MCGRLRGQSGTGRQGGRGEEIPLTFLSSMPFPLPTVPPIDKTRLTAKEERSLGDLVHRGQRWVDRAGTEQEGRGESQPVLAPRAQGVALNCFFAQSVASRSRQQGSKCMRPVYETCRVAMLLLSMLPLDEGSEREKPVAFSCFPLFKARRTQISLLHGVALLGM